MVSEVRGVTDWRRDRARTKTPSEDFGIFLSESMTICNGRNLVSALEPLKRSRI